jgi:diguanylate cyclase (GGDEF)-like protein
MLFASKAVLQSKRQKQKIFVLFTDLDGLKHINDTKGHQVGDEYLVAAAKLLVSSFREVDIIARMGGDEFAVLGIINEQCIPESLIDRLQFNIQNFNSKNFSDYPLSMSTGLATYDPSITDSIEHVIDRADEEMYKQKRARKQGRIFSE